MEIQFTCDACGQLITASEEMLGCAVDCPNPACGCHLTVPSEPTDHSSDITFDCPFCQYLLVVSEKGAGKEVACPECGKRIVIPERTEDATPPEQHDSPNFYYADESSQPVGPHDAAHIRELFNQGLLNMNSWVIVEGATDWQSYMSLFLPTLEATQSGSRVKRCPTCGAENGSQTQLCVACGATLKSPPATKRPMPQSARADLTGGVGASEIQCASCGQALAVPASLEGKRMDCPRCGNSALVRPEATRSQPREPQAFSDPGSDRRHRLNRSFILRCLSIGVLLIAGAATCVRYFFHTPDKVSANAPAASPEDAYKAFERLQKEALTGRPELQKHVGDIYASGKAPADPSLPKGFYQVYKERGTPEELQKAVEWYQRAALQGYVEAQFALGALLGTSRSPKGVTVAKVWYLVASKYGHKAAPRALHDLEWETKDYSDIDPAIVAEVLTVIAKYGKPAPADERSLFETYQKAALTGDSEAQLNLAVLYEEGIGVPKDMVRASAWYVVSAACTPKNPQCDLINKVTADFQAQDRAGRMTPEQNAEAEKLATELLKQINKE